MGNAASFDTCETCGKIQVVVLLRHSDSDSLTKRAELRFALPAIPTPGQHFYLAPIRLYETFTEIIELQGRFLGSSRWLQF